MWSSNNAIIQNQELKGEVCIFRDDVFIRHWIL